MKSALLKIKNNSGFTLIELLVVILIISALAVVAFAALNPAKRLEDSRNARRTADVDSILTAVHQYIVDQGGNSSGLGLTTADQMLGTSSGVACPSLSANGCTVAAAACVNLSASTLLGKYLGSIPFDPGTNGTAGLTQYTVNENADGIVTVKACGKEGTANANISASR